MVCVATANGLLWGGDTHGRGGVQGPYGENNEQDLRQSGGGGATGVLSCGRRGAEGAERVLMLCVAWTKAVGGCEEGAHVARPTGGVAGKGAHVGDQQAGVDRSWCWTWTSGGRRLEPYGGS